MNTTTSLAISATAQQIGYGCDRYKTVTGLTADEKSAVAAGTRMFFRAARLSSGRTGTNWRVAVTTRGARTVFAPRVPSADEIAQLRAATSLN